MAAGESVAAVGADLIAAAGDADSFVVASNPALPAIEYRDRVESTNDVAIEAARMGAPNGWAIAADEQVAGRGRRGHAWASARGGLYLSIVLRPDVPMGFFVALPAVASMGVMDALRGIGLENRVGIKWPNDIVARCDAVESDDSTFDRKLVGILTEARSGEDGPFAVAGIGVNLAPVDAACTVGDRVSGGVPPLAPVSLAELAGGRSVPTRDELAESIRAAVMARIDSWAAALRRNAAAGPLAPVLSEYFDMMPMVGRDVAVVDPSGRVADAGCFSGVDVWGRAIVRMSAGQERSIPAEAASLREVR